MSGRYAAISVEEEIEARNAELQTKVEELSNEILNHQKINEELISKSVSETPSKNVQKQKCTGCTEKRAATQ